MLLVASDEFDDEKLDEEIKRISGKIKLTPLLVDLLGNTALLCEHANFLSHKLFSRILTVL